MSISKVVRVLKKTIKYSTIVLVSLIFIASTLLYILLGTDKGFQYVLDTASDKTSGVLKYEKVTGNFFAGLELDQLLYKDAAMAITVKKFNFDWQPKQLFSARLWIDKLTADGVDFKQLSTAPEQEKIEDDTTPVTEKLPEIVLPIDIYLKQLQITDITILPAPESETTHIDEVRLQTDFINGKVNLHELALTMPEVKALLNGNAELTNNYPLLLKNDISLNIPDQPPLKINGTIDGNIELIKLKQQTSGLVEVLLDAQASQLLAELNWKADLQLKQLSLETFLPEQNELIKANLNAHGDLKQAVAQIKANILPTQSSVQASNQVSSEVSKDVAQEKSIQEESTQSTPTQTPAQLDVNANIIFADQSFKSKAQWQHLQWPLSGVAAFASETGLLQIDGVPDDYKLSLQLNLAGSDVPKGDWQANAKGNLSQININSLHGDTLNGVIDINSTVGWQDAIEWQAEVQTQKIDPGQFSAQFPGSLDIILKTRGKMVADALNANLKLEQFSGQLREKPLAGGGEFDIVNEQISIKHFNLSSGDAKLEVDGLLDKKMDLNWSLAVAQLSDLLPQAKGSINGQGSLAGTMELPVLNADLKLSNIVYQSTHIHQADLQCALHLDPTINSQLHLDANEINLSSGDGAAQIIKQIKLALDGPLEKHQLNLFVNHEQAKLDLKTAGKFDQEQLSWDGDINKLIIDSADYGKWQQTKPSKLYASAQKAQLSSLCLQEQTTNLCAKLDWTPEKGNADINLKNLSFDRAKPFLPREIQEFTGSIDLLANVDLGPVLLAHLKTEIKPGKITYQPIGKEPIKLDHKNGLVEVNYNSSQLDGKWNIDFGPHKINGNVNVPRTAIEKDPMTAPVNGNVGININDLEVVTIVAPQINEIDGHLTANLKLGGNASNPRINGQAELIAKLIEIQDLGTRYEDVNVIIQGKDNGKALAIKGGLHSGEGDLMLDGLVTLDAEQGFPVQVKLKGEQFLVINIPDAYAIVSPDIQFSQTKGLMDIKGTILIPEASISPQDIPEGSVGTSSDVVIVGEEAETPPNMNLEVTVTLGEKVYIRAFGLKTDLTGEMAIHQKPKQLMTAHGELHLENGTFRAYGQDLTIDEGSVFYAGGYLDNPGLKFSASRKVRDTQVGIKVSGTAKKPSLVTFSDDPGLADNDIVSLMLTGQKTDNLGSAQIYAGKDISDKLSVGVNAGMGDEGSEFVARYRLTDKIQLEGTSSSAKSGGSVLYTFEVE